MILKDYFTNDTHMPNLILYLNLLLNSVDILITTIYDFS